jgi:hypothetical protein
MLLRIIVLNTNDVPAKNTCAGFQLYIFFSILIISERVIALRALKHIQDLEN